MEIRGHRRPLPVSAVLNTPQGGIVFSYLIFSDLISTSSPQLTHHYYLFPSHSASLSAGIRTHRSPAAVPSLCIRAAPAPSLTSLSLQLDANCAAWTQMLTANAATLQSLWPRATHYAEEASQPLSDFFKLYYAPWLRRLSVEVGSDAARPHAAIHQPLWRAQLTADVHLGESSRATPSFLEHWFGFLFPAVTECSVRVGWRSQLLPSPTPLSS